MVMLVTPRSASFEVASCDFIFFRTARSPLSAISRSISPARRSASNRTGDSYWRNDKRRRSIGALPMLGKLLSALSKAVSYAVGFSVVLGPTIAFLLLIVGPTYVPWWRATLEKHTLLIILLLLMLASHFVAGGILSASTRKSIRFLDSPEGKRRRAEQVQRTIDAIVAEAEARPKLDLHQMVLDKSSAASVITEARRLAKKAAEDELRRRFARFPSGVEVTELSRIANALLTTDPIVIETAKANVAKRASVSPPLTTDRIRFAPNPTRSAYGAESTDVNREPVRSRHPRR